MLVEGRWRLLRELVPASSNLGLPVLVRATRSGTATPSFSRHGFFDDLDEALSLPFTLDVFDKTQLGRRLIPLVTLTN